MIIRSKIHTIHYTRPIAIWVLATFIAACACSPGQDEESYHFKSFFNATFIITGIIFTTSAFIILNMRTLSVIDVKFIYKNHFTRSSINYTLTDIIDFTWSGRPVVTGGRYGPRSKLSNDMFTLRFKDGNEITIYISQYANFKEIRAFFYNYCIKHGIIHMRSLEDRKKSILDQ